MLDDLREVLRVTAASTEVLREALRERAACSEGGLAMGLSRLAAEPVGGAPVAVVVADEHRDRGCVQPPEHVEVVLPDPPGRDAGAWVREHEGLFVRATWLIGVVTAKQLLSSRERAMLRAVFQRAPGPGALVVLDLDAVGDERSGLLARARRFAGDQATVVEPADLAFEPVDWEEGWRRRARAALRAQAIATPAVAARETAPGAPPRREGPPPLEVGLQVEDDRVVGVRCPRLPWLREVLVDLSGADLEARALERIGGALPADVRADLEVRVVVFQ